MLFCWINVVLISLIVFTSCENLLQSDSCDLPSLRRCYRQAFNTTLRNIQGDSKLCRSAEFETHVICAKQHLKACKDHVGSITSVLLEPYITVLETVHLKACSQGLEPVDCDFKAAEKCLLHFGEVLSHGQLGPICRQAEVTLQCLEKPLGACSGIPRYFVALVTDEIKLTSDLACHQGGCDLEVVRQCLHDVMETLDFPVAIVAQSSVICSKIRNALACVTNRTMECDPDSIPESIVQQYYQLYQLSIDNCGVVSEGLRLMNTPVELLGPVYLAVLVRNTWTSEEQICHIYNKSLTVAAHYGDIMMTYADSLLTWQHSMEVTMEIYTDLCLPQTLANCDWLSHSAIGETVCDIWEAEKCLDIVLVSKMVVEASLQRRSWENICSHTHNMMVCASHFLAGCKDFEKVKSVNQSVQTVVQLVGDHCNLVGTGYQSETCDEVQPEPECDLMKALEECGRDQILACLASEEVFQCFHGNTDGCSSVAKTGAQFYMEWLLQDCPVNKTLLSHDILSGLSSCAIQLGYNLYNGLQMASDFVAVICAADDLYQACLLSETVPQMAQLYLQPTADMIKTFRQNMCINASWDNLLLLNSEESDSCNWDHISSQLSRYLMIMSNFPLLSIKQQQQVCSSLIDLPDISPCSSQRQSIIQQAVMFLGDLYNLHCQKGYLQRQRSCDTKKMDGCLENFGASLNFASSTETVCSKLQKTYQCIYDNMKDCDMPMESHLLSEVKAIQSMLGNLTCPLMPWCGNIPVNQSMSAVAEQMCASSTPCSLDWSSCVAYAGNAYCLNLTETQNCIKEKLSGCDPLQYVMAKNFMVQNIQTSFLPCNFVPDDPPSVLPVHYSINQCQQIFAMVTDVTRSGLCNAIGQYIQCVMSVDQSELPSLWRGILGRNALLWQKRWYLDCQLTDGEKFIVSQNFSEESIQGDRCQSVQGQMCLGGLADMSVSYVILPLTERRENLCDIFAELFGCVWNEVAGCTSPQERAMLTSAQWLSEKLESTGVCSSTSHVTRDCDPAAALTCISELGTTMITGSLGDKVACSQFLTTSACVDEMTSSCDYNTRNDVVNTFSLVSSLVQQWCSQEPSSEPQGCLVRGETIACDLEEILTCMVPVRAKMLQPQLTSLVEVCGMIPAMKACIQRQSSGCDINIMTIVNQQLLRLNTRLGNQCPQMYCEECKAPQCLADLYYAQQYHYEDLCVLVAETKQCVYDNAQYCERNVGEMLLREMALLVGEEGQRCEVKLPACLRTLMLSAFQVMNYNTNYVTMATNSSSADLAFISLCNEAATAYFCVSYHVSGMEGSRQWIMNETLQEIGHLVSQTCQGTRLQCYSCINATTNEECNSQPVQTCSPDMQSCGTVVVSNGYLSKGCVRSETCQTGCYGDTCTMCCQGDMCNQPWNGVITEPLSCQPRSALWCGFQLLSSLAQNETVDCRTLQEAIDCMASSTANCALQLSLSLGVHAHRLLGSDVMGDCISRSSVCSCGQCTSLILLSLISNQYTRTEEFCRMAGELYNQTLTELRQQECSMTTLQSTMFNINMALYLASGVCDIADAERECIYNGEIYPSGSSFNATDGCNTCGCRNGHSYCTPMFCPPDTSEECPPVDPDTVGICVEECSSDSDCPYGLLCCSNGCGHTCQPRYTQGDSDCRYGNTTYKSSDSFMDRDGCNVCFCSNGQVGCTLMYCPPEDSQCQYNGNIYITGESFDSTDGCNVCFCYHGYIGCTEMACLPPGDGICYYGNQLYQTGDVFNSADDDCNACVCADGLVGCTQIQCPSKEVQCYYGNKIYMGGDTFPALDGCNRCFCSSAGVACTWRLCPPSVNTTHPPGCDLEGVHNCIEDAALPTLSALAMLGNTEHICMSAKNMLRCVHTKIDSCPTNLLTLVRETVWWNLGFAQNYCDIQEIISFYNNESRPGKTSAGNHTADGQCSVNQAFSCFHDVSRETLGICSAVQSVIDCVEELINGCVSVARVPVLYELQLHLLPVRDVCNYTLPFAGHHDPLYLISQCTVEFTDGIEEALTDMYFRRGSKTPVCDRLDSYLRCLYTAQQYVLPVGSFYINNIVMSLTTMIRECQLLRQEEELLTCHVCDWSTSEQECDRQPTQRCLPNQVCRTTVHQDVSTDVAMVTKGCADISWCQSWYGCNPYTMTCVHCCHGDLCNVASNVTFTFPPVTETPRATTERPPVVDQCDISLVSGHMVILMVQITNFNFMPLREKQLFCLNFNARIDQALVTMDSKCNNVTRDRVHVIAEWLSNLRDDVCPDQDAEVEAWEKCMGSVRCLQGLGNFTDRSEACRRIKASEQCLHPYYRQCPRNGQRAINRTLEMMGYMDDLVCISETLIGPEPQCVNVTSNKPSAVCNVSAALECGMAVHRALYSPFTTREELCRKMKIGMQCIQDNTFNCSSDVYQQVGAVVMEILHQSPDLCPHLWCPVDPHCRLDVANECLNDLERRIVNVNGEIGREFCLNLSITHNCVWNATERCHNTDTRQVLQRYSQILRYLAPYCQQYTIPTEDCLRQFLSSAQYLDEFDQIFTLKLTYAVRDYIIMGMLEGSGYSGLALPGVLLLGGSWNNTNLAAGIALPDVFQSVVGSDSPNGSLTGIGLPNVQDHALQDFLRLFTSSNIESSDIQFLFSGVNFGFNENFVNMSLAEFLYMLMYQSYFGGNIRENLAEFGSLHNASMGSNGTMQGYRLKENRFSGYSRRKKRSLAPNQPERAGNRNTFGQDGFFGPDRLRQGLDNGTADSGTHGTNANNTTTNNAANETNIDGNFINSDGTYSNITNNRPYLFNGTHYANASVILSMLNLTLPDLNRFLDQSIYSLYSNSKMAACAELRQMYSCLHDNLVPHLHLVEPLRGYILEYTSEALLVNTLEHCQDLQCHSCVGLDDNQECNRQPLMTCNPLEVCQSRFTDGHIFKGCASAWSCDHECRQSSGPCYCCHGNLCNEPSHALDQTCNIREASYCASRLLEHALNSRDLNRTYISDKARCMMRAARGCHTTIQQNLGELGNGVLQSVTCFEDSRPGSCGPGPSLLAVHDSLLAMYGSKDVICKLINSSLETYFAYQHSNSCYGNYSHTVSSLHREVLRLKYNGIYTLCPHNKAYLLYQNIQPCSSDNHTVAMDTSGDAMNITVTITTNRDGSNGTDDGTQGENSTNTESSCEINFEDFSAGPVCWVAMAAEKCLMPNQTSLDNGSETEVFLSCFHQYTRDCVSVQFLSIVDQLGVALSTDLLRRDHLASLSLCLYKYLNSSNEFSNQFVMENVCQVTDDVMGCLETEKHQHQLPIYTSVIDNMADYIRRLTEQVCNNEDMTSLCFNQTAAEMKSEIIKTVTLHLAPLEEISDKCRSHMMSHDSSLDLSSFNTSSDCTGNHPGLQAWRERELDQLCSRQIVQDLCVQPTCDVAMATNLIYEMSHYFFAVHYSDGVFCRKLEYLLDSMKCYLHDCNETYFQTVKENLVYIRSVVQERCPYSAEMFCDSWLETYLTPKSYPPPLPPPPHTPRRPPVVRPDRLRILRRRDSTTSLPAPPETSSAPPETEGPPAPPETPSAPPETEGPPAPPETPPTQLETGEPPEPTETPQQCLKPQCSFQEAVHCLDKLQGNTSSCGNSQEVFSCIELSMIDCSDYQKYPLHTILWSKAMKLGIQKECWENRTIYIDPAHSLGYTGCVNSLVENVGKILDVIEETEFVACELLLSYLGCVKDVLRSSDGPAPLQYHMNHLTLVTEKSVTAVCQNTDDRFVVKQEGKESCDLDQARFCLTSYSVSILMAPTMTPGDKLWVCQKLNSAGMGCVDQALTGCSQSTTRGLKTVHDLVTMLGHWSGVCTPHQSDCSPHVAMECMSQLEDVMNNKIHYGNSDRVCRAIELANICVKQTISRCDPEMKKNLLEIFEPIKCQAYSFCPMAVEKRAVTMEIPPSCFNPTSANKEGACDPGRALSCILDFYGDYMEPDVTKDKICFSYSQALQCYFTNVQQCDGDIPVLLAHQYLHMMTETVEGMCPTVISTSCDPEQRSRGCDLSQVEACITQVETKMLQKITLQPLRDADMCNSLETAKSCMELHTSECPRATSLYARSLLLKLTSDERLSDLECNTAESCGWGYVQQLITVLGHHIQLMNDSLPAMGVISDIEAEMEYLCKRRHSSLECVRNFTHSLPEDVAKLNEQTLEHLENLFSYTCGELFTLQTCVSCTSTGCLRCYADTVEFYLPPLLSFLNGDDQNLTFCSEPLNTTFWYPFLQDICPDGQDAGDWNMFYTQSIHSLYRKYCLMPCNQSMAEECLQNFQNQSLAMPSEVCGFYDELQLCLNRSVTSCSYDVVADYLTQAELLLAGTGVICYVMPTLVVESADMIYLEEGGSAQYIDVTLTSAVGDSCHGNHCEVEIIVFSKNFQTSSCLNGNLSPQFILSSCAHTFSGETSQISIPVTATIDHKVDPQPATDVEVVARLWEDGANVAMETVSKIPVSVVDVDTSAVCTAQGAYMTTFDGYFYGNFYTGEFIIYQHTEQQYKVQVAIQKCKKAGRCLCAVMVQVDDDVYVLGQCVRSGEKTHPLELYSFVNGEMVGSLHIYRSDDGSRFQFVLPSGTIITADSLDYDLSVRIQPSPQDRYSTRGLCGIFDYNMVNDLTRPDGTTVSVDDISYMVSNLGVYRPKPFLKAWRTTDTLLEGVPASESRLEPSVSSTWCDCTNMLGLCVPQDLVQTCDFVEGEEITGIMALLSRTSEQTSITVRTRRARRQTSSGGIDWGDGDEEDLSGLIFPTASGITETTANTACTSALVDSDLGQICSNIIDTTNLVIACVTDVLLLDSVEEAIAISVRNLQQQCVTAVITDPTLADNLNTTSLVPDFLSLSCPSNCSGQGTCEQGTCQCNSGNAGSDCSLSVSQAPLVIGLSPDIYSATSAATMVTMTTTVLGYQFINSPSLLCHLEVIELTDSGFNKTGPVFTEPAIFITAQSVSCPVTGSLPLTVLLLSVSNNGVNKSTEAMYIIQDPVCYDCDAVVGNCSLKPTSCVVDGSCYPAGAYNPSDQCLICDPFSNQWRYKISQSCPATTTSSATVSIQSSTPSSVSPSISVSSTDNTLSTSGSSGQTSSSVWSDSTSRSTVSTSSHSTTESSSGRTISANQTSAPSSSSLSTAVSSVSPSGSVSTATSATPKSSTSSGSTSTSSAQTSPSTTPPSSSPKEGTGDGQEADDTQTDRQTLIIVIVVASVVGLIIIVGIVVVSCRLRKQDTCNMGHKLDSPPPTRREPSPHRGIPVPELQGTPNPAFENVVYDSYGQPVVFRPRATSQQLGAPFDPRGLGIVTDRGSGPPDEEDGLHRVNVHIFDHGPRDGARRGDDYYIQYDSERPLKEPVPDENTRL